MWSVSATLALAVTSGEKSEDAPARGMPATMTSPPLYKYLSVEGARLTLGNRCFRHAKPSTFNDTEDLTVRSLFPEDDEIALGIIENGFTDLLLNHVDDVPTCLNEGMRAKVALILAAFKANPDAARIVKEAKTVIPSVFDLEQMKQRHLDFVAEINAFMQGFRILCVSSRKDSDRMWDRYAEGHRGIVLKISPNIVKDSKFQRFGIKRPGQRYTRVLKLFRRGSFSVINWLVSERPWTRSSTLKRWSGNTKTNTGWLFPSTVTTIGIH